VVTVHMASEDDIPTGTLRSIAEQCGAEGFEAWCRWIDENCRVIQRQCVAMNSRGSREYASGTTRGNETNEVRRVDAGVPVTLGQRIRLLPMQFGGLRDTLLRYVTVTTDPLGFLGNWYDYPIDTLTTR
jgi:hypothetical protein